MRRIVYLCPADDVPAGGIKVIYRHVAALRALGAPAFVLHPENSAFRCSWFDHDVTFLDSPALCFQTDLVVIPEIWAGSFGRQCLHQGLRYVLFVQNGYSTFPLRAGEDRALLEAIYHRAALVLVISDDTAEMVALNYPAMPPERVVPVRFAVGAPFVRAASGGGKAISFMPRKLAEHAARVVFALRPHLPPGWRLTPIDGVDERDCAALLASSRVFLAFSDFEGLAMPPLEAALAGNLVIGYTGQGAREYWAEPNFQAIEQGDIIGFVKAARDAAWRMERGLPSHEALEPGRLRLAQRYSAEVEAACLTAVLIRMAALPGPPA